MLSSMVPALDLDRVVASTVSDLWRNSPIKTFVPVLALRLTREAILAETRDESMLERGIPPRSPHSTR